MVTFDIRQYVDSDLHAVKELHILGLDQTGTNIGPGDWDHDLDDISGTYIQNGGEFLVVESDRHIVGMGALLRHSDTDAEIKRMRVHVDAQRQGIGRSILTRLEMTACQLGYRRLFRDTTVQQGAAVAFYQSAGYVEFDRTMNHGFECTLFEKHLT